MPYIRYTFLCDIFGRILTSVILPPITVSCVAGVPSLRPFACLTSFRDSLVTLASFFRECSNDLVVRHVRRDLCMRRGEGVSRAGKVHARMGMACLATRERIESPILKEIATRLVHSGYTGRYRGGGVEGGACVYGRGGQRVENRVTYQLRLVLAHAVNRMKIRFLARNSRKRSSRFSHSSMPARAALLGRHLYIIGSLV